MLRRAVLLVVLAGCDVVFGIDGKPMAPIDAAPPGDVGHPADARDAGPGHDEDGDGVDDSVDNCPNVKNADQANGDTDNAGDVCDPHADMALEHAVYFSPLRSFMDWMVAGGMWVQDDDAVVLQPIAGDQFARLGLTAYSMPTVTVVADSPMPFESRMTNFGVFLESQMVDAATAMFPLGVGCYVDTGKGVVTLQDNRLGTALPSDSVFQPLPPVRFVIGPSFSGTPTCTVTDSTGVSATVTSPISMALTSGRVELYAADGGVAFESVFVVTQP